MLHAVATATDLACRAVGRRQAVLAPLGYRLGKLTPRGVEFYPGWDADLETFVEGNYVVCVPQVAGRLPSVTWWKSAS